MNNLKSVSDAELLSQTQAAALSEKQATVLLLEHLLEIDRRELALSQGYSSIWDYVHRRLKYSEAAASERVAAMGLLRRAPESKQMLKEETLSLTVAAKVHHFVRAVEKSEKRKVETRETVSLLREVTGKSKREVEKLLIAKSPRAAILKWQIGQREQVRAVSENLSEVKLLADTELMRLMEEAKVLFGCANQAETLRRSLKVAIEVRKKKLGLTESQTQPAVAHDTKTAVVGDPNNSIEGSLKTHRRGKLHSRYIPVHIQKALWRRAKGQCEYSGNQARCTSRHKLQTDHIMPLALGGTTELHNLRLLCQNHNLAEARSAGLAILSA